MRRRGVSAFVLLLIVVVGFTGGFVAILVAASLFGAIFG